MKHQPEIGEHRVIFVWQQDVRRLHIPVKHVVRMGMMQRVGDLSRQLHRAANVQPTGPQDLAERRSVDELHDDVATAVVTPAPIVNLHHTLVLQLPRGPRFAQELRHRVFGQSVRVTRYFNGHDPIRVRVLGLVDLTETSRRPDRT